MYFFKTYKCEVMTNEGMTFIMIPELEWNFIKEQQKEILDQLKVLQEKRNDQVPTNYITAKEFMETLRIKRTKFDQLVQTNKIRIIKKERKIYVPVKEIDRYFNHINS